MVFEFETIEIKGYEERIINSTLLKQKRGAGPISVIFPGLRYNIDMPLLYYCTGVLVEAGHSVLTVDTRYAESDEFMSSTNEERRNWMFKDADAIHNKVQQLEGYEISILVGKSLGTIQMSYLLQTRPSLKDCKSFWLTPLLKLDWVLNQMIAHQGKSLVVIGTADSHYSDEAVSRLATEGKCEVMKIVNGNHSLDVPAGVLGSIQELTSIMTEFKNFI